MRIPDSLAWWRGEPGGAEWLDSLPRLAGECADEWGLSLGEPLAGGNVALVLAATRADGTAAALKLNFPEPESAEEADALELWAGEGAVRLLEHDRERGALLLERCQPGVPLWALQDEDEACRIAARVLERIWRPPPEPHPFRLLAHEAARWRVELERDWEVLGRPFDQRLLAAVLAALGDLPATQGENVVLHQDFHGGNVLRAEREPWLAIDPKPLVGEREFDAASLLRDRRWEIGRRDAPKIIRRRLELLSSELGLDRERTRGWGIAHALAWGVDADGVEADMVESARLILDA